MAECSANCMPLLGDKFPEMQVKTTHGMKNLPGDFTFAKRADQFEALHADLIGMSVDQVFSHIKWVDWIQDKLELEMPFPIIADTRAAAEKLGMIHPGLGSNTVRAVFIADDAGTLRWIVYYPQEVGRNVDEILRSLKALQIASANRVAMPADWPNNDLIGDRVIVPPARTVADSRRRPQEYGCYDWWFRHKPLEE